MTSNVFTLLGSHVNLTQEEETCLFRAYQSLFLRLARGNKEPYKRSQLIQALKNAQSLEAFGHGLNKDTVCVELNGALNIPEIKSKFDELDKNTKNFILNVIKNNGPRDPPPDPTPPPPVWQRISDQRAQALLTIIGALLIRTQDKKFAQQGLVLSLASIVSAAK